MFQEQEFCRSCGLLHPAKQLSNRGLCAKCAMERVMRTLFMLQEHKGWLWRKWRRNYIAAMDGVLNRLRKELREND